VTCNSRLTVFDGLDSKQSKSKQMTWRKGESGNPGGRVGVPAEVRELARAHTKDAIDRLAHWLKSDNPAASVAAANALLDRGYGKPAQVVNLSVEDMSRRLAELSSDELSALRETLQQRLAGGQPYDQRH
jgi:hypothetical protein